MKCIHTFEHYKKSIQDAINLGNVFLKMEEFAKCKDLERVIFLRHDIDLSVKNALKMAQIESELNINSTYFIRVSGKYNSFFYDNHKTILQIKALNHEIGLHFAQDIPIILDEPFKKFFFREKSIIESLIDEKVKGCSIHDPNHSIINDSNLKEYDLQYHAYSDNFTKKIKYISDSRANWRDGCMCKNIGKFDKLCILTHPFWWYKRGSCENY